MGILSVYSQSSLYFDGVDDYVNVSNPDLEVGNAITVEAWIKAESWQPMLYKGTVISNGNNSGGDNGFDFRAAENGKAEFNISVDGAWVTATTDALMSVNEWNHIAATYDGATLKVYVNGVLEVSNQTSGTISAFGGDLFFAECPGWTGRFFNGNIDEVRIYNVALTSEEIMADICSPLTGSEAGITGYWPMNEGSGTTVVDESENSNDGTLLHMDIASCWQDNYECNLTNADVGVSVLVSPQSGFELTNAETVTVTINNYSLDVETGFDVSYQVNGGDIVTETVTEDIPGLGTLDFTFSQTVDLSAYGEYEFVCTTLLDGDINNANNSNTSLVYNFSDDANFSLEFDGIDDEVAIANTDEINPTESLTVEAWIYANSWRTNIWQGAVVSKVQGDPDRGYTIVAGRDGRAEFQISDNGSWSGAQSGPVMLLNRWYHLAGVFDGSTVKLYINGILQAQNSASQIAASDCDLLIGECPGWGGNRNFDGRIDEVRIWDIARTQQDISDAMTDELQGDEAGLVAYYPMNDGIGSEIAADNSQNNFDGTLNNMDLDIAWTQGFELLTNDVGVSAILAPVSAPEFSGDARVKVVVSNFGFNTVSGIPVAYSLGGDDVVTEIMDAEIPAFGSKVYCFKQIEDISGYEEITVESHTAFEEDDYDDNNSASCTVYESNIITPFDHVQHNFDAAGQVHDAITYFPESYENIQQILMHIKLTCPELGCDPWDQPAKISVITDEGLSIEIGRYITPFGIPWEEGWTIDVTDFKSLLKGRVHLQSLIQAWGASGWLLTCEFEFVAGTPDYQYYDLYHMWNDDYQIYGDPDISYDLEEITVDVPESTQEATLRVTTSGHGQGNTDNAAEFSHKIHHIWIDGAETFEQDLWKDDCNVNPCSPQNGTWQHSRAGWCPGQDVIPDWYNLEGNYTAGESVTLDYVLEDYTNLLNTGYNGNSHTEPHYRIHSCLVFKGEQPLSEYVNAGVSAVIAPQAGNLSENEEVIVQITNYGNVDISGFEVSYRIANTNQKVTEIYSDVLSAGESVEYSFEQKADLSESIIYRIEAMTTVVDDEITSDDYAVALVECITGTITLEKGDVVVYPNPAKDILTVDISNITGSATLKLRDIRGSVVWKQYVDISGSRVVNINVNDFVNGIYLLEINTSQGIVIRKIELV